ncbi:cyanophycinase [Litorilituus sediminis]|uniref:Cyanophycinase n=1 Tax=Litorilituus sediminis TaxID=718192 RepID=A0A4P6P801_9GAMM|nr:cyanophycinase [Litorilituus sediminis]QBG35595.1 hypothetical protein EMK97_07650 [Litorilituus sediminis]
MLLKSLILLLSLLILPTSSAKEFSEHAKLFLVGGGLKTCSSMSVNQCLSTKLIESDDKSQALYQISKESIDLLFQYWPSDHLERQKKALKPLLEKMRQANKGVLNKSQLRRLWIDNGGKKLINQLADREYYLMLDALELGLVNDKDFRRSERVSLANTKNQFSREIFESFTQLAGLKAAAKGKKAPDILVVTASARDPFEAVDFYVDVFSQAGAAVTWLPIDAGLNALWQERGQAANICHYLEQYQADKLGTIKRKFVYPDHFLTQQQWCQSPQRFINAIQQADGLFINGGDQSLTLQAFKNKDGSDNALLAAIRKQVDSNQLVIGGTSAGTAVMSGGIYDNKPIPMITNGRSAAALVRGAKADVLPSAGCQKDNQCGDVLNEDLTFNSQGGLGLFTWGIMDTHFSERGRQGRLVRLLEDTETRFAFGVDEATALVVAWQQMDTITMQVVGQTGVYIVEQGTGENKGKTLTHFPTRDDVIKLQHGQLSFTFADWKSPVVEKSLTQNFADIFEGENYLVAVDALCRASAQKQKLVSHYNESEIQISLLKGKNWHNGVGKFSTPSGEKSYCSYQNVSFYYQVN